MHVNFGRDIDDYLHLLQMEHSTEGTLERHKITPNLRARMVDWMIEVLTNFKCDDQTFFLAISLMDRFFKSSPRELQIQDLHIIGVSCMFIASKYEDIYPLKMKMVFEKIAHKKISVDKIKQLELEICKAIKYRIPAPVSLEFVRLYLQDIMGITSKLTHAGSSTKSLQSSPPVDQ